MHRAAVVPEDRVAWSPLMRIGELRLRCERLEFVQKLDSFFPRHPSDRGFARIDDADEQYLLPGLRVRAHEGVGDVR